MQHEIFVNERSLHIDAAESADRVAEAFKAKTFQSQTRNNQRESRKEEDEKQRPIFLGNFRPHSCRRENHLKSPNHSRECRERGRLLQVEIVLAASARS